MTNTTTNSTTSSKGSTSTTSNSTGDNSECSAEECLSELMKTFSLSKSSGMVSSAVETVKDGCSIDWNSMLLPTSKPSTASATAASSSSSSWTSTLDYLKSFDFSGSTQPNTTSTGTTTTSTSNNPSYSKDIYDRLGSLSNQLMAESRITTSVTKQLEERISNYLSDTFQFTTAGIFFGAVVGAAVATGVMIGMIAVVGAASSSDYYMTMYPPKWYLRNMSRRLGFGPQKNNDNKPHSDNTAEEHAEPSNSSSTTNTSTVQVANGPLIIIHGNPSLSPSLSSSKEQCESCLQQIGSRLKEQDMSWNAIRRITAYLVAGKCDAATFRTALQQQQQKQRDNLRKAPNYKPLVNIVFVQQLEEEHAMLQVEAMASN